MKKIAVLGVVILLAGLMTGCCTGVDDKSIPENCGGTRCDNSQCPIHFIKTSGHGDKIAVMIDVLDDTEGRWFFGTKIWAPKAELWLKLSISHTPDIYWLYPLNINHKASGNRNILLKTPFFVTRDRQGKIIAELLDEDELSKEEVKLLTDAAKVSGMLLCDGINIYARKKNFSHSELISLQNKEAISNIMEQCATVMIKNMKPFDSYGYREYIVLHTGSEFVSNPLTIVDENGRARCDLRFHLVK